MIIETSSAPSLIDCFLYGRIGSGKTHFLLTAPGIVHVDFEDGDFTARDMDLTVPVIRPKTEEEVFEIILYPEEVIEQIHKTPGFEEYPVETFGFDTASSYGDILMGRAPSKSPDGKRVPGTGLMAISRTRNPEDEPSMEDWKSLSHKMLKFFQAVHAMPYHTVVTCHTEIRETPESPKGLSVKPESRIYAGYPMLPGQLRYDKSGKLADFVLYLEQRSVGADKKGPDGKVQPGKGRFFAHTRPFGVYHARTRLFSKLPASLENPSFNMLLNALEKEIEGGK